VLYVVWETTSTPDTYYSCSDLIVKASAVAAVPPKANAAKAAPLTSRSPEPGAVVQPADAAGPAVGAGAPAAKESWLTRDGDQVAIGEQIVSTAVIVLVGVGAAMAVMWLRRRRTPQQIPRGFEKR
jgi:chitin-binding protein